MTVSAHSSHHSPTGLKDSHLATCLLNPTHLPDAMAALSSESSSADIPSLRVKYSRILSRMGRYLADGQGSIRPLALLHLLVLVIRTRIMHMARGAPVRRAVKEP